MVCKCLWDLSVHYFLYWSKFTCTYTHHKNSQSTFSARARYGLRRGWTLVFSHSCSPWTQPLANWQTHKFTKNHTLQNMQTSTYKLNHITQRCFHTVNRKVILEMYSCGSVLTRISFINSNLSTLTAHSDLKNNYCDITLPSDHFSWVCSAYLFTTNSSLSGTDTLVKEKKLNIMLLYCTVTYLGRNGKLY